MQLRSIALLLCFTLLLLLLPSGNCQTDSTDITDSTDDVTELTSTQEPEETDSTDSTSQSESTTDAATRPPPSSTVPSPSSPPTQSSSAPSPSTEAPSPTTGAPSPNTTAPLPTSGAPSPSTEAPSPTTEAPSPTTEAPSPTTEAPSPNTTAPSPTTGATATETQASPSPSESPSNSSTMTSAAPTQPSQIEYEVSTQYGSFLGITYEVTVGYSASKMKDRMEIGPRDASTFSTKQISKFLGIPYAMPPTGSRRFLPPQPAPRSNSSINATTMPPNCPQAASSGTSEDCLYMNVWTPQTAGNANSSKTFPVLVWIHGGRFLMGGSNDGLTEGEEIVIHEDVVVVTFNYRLGALGFLSSIGTANLGIQDQRLAVKMISEIVPAFGGDASKLTLMGLDAGSASVGLHMMDSAASSLFSRAIMMGGSPMMPWSLVPNTEFYHSVSRAFAASVDCSQSVQAELLRCLQSVPVDRILAAQNGIRLQYPGFYFSTIVDGSVVAADPWYSFSVGNFSSKPLLIGATNDEGADIVEDGLLARNISISDLDDATLRRLVLESFPFYPRADQKLTAAGRNFLQLHYTNRGGFNNGRANYKILSDAIGDFYLACPVVQMAKFAEAAAGISSSNKVYMYYFTEKEILQNIWDGASHGVDAKYAFGIPTKSAGIAYPPEKKALSERIMRQFVRFADSGIPEQDPILWKPLNFSAGEINFINFTADSTLLGNQRLGYRIPQCHFWNQTLAFVNEQGKSEMITTTMPLTTSRWPIGPQPASCAWAFTETAATILGVMGVVLGITAAVLIYFIMRTKSLARVANVRNENVAMR